MEDAEFIFICVGTPSGVDGEADLQYVRMAAESVAKVMKSPLIIITRAPSLWAGDWVADIAHRSRTEPVEFAVVSCPEFTRGLGHLRLHEPDRVVVGSHNQEAAEKVAQLHLPLRTRIVMTDLRTAEMIIRQQCVPRHQDQLHQRDCRHLRATGCGCGGGGVWAWATTNASAPYFLSAGLLRRQLLPQGCQSAGALALVHGSHPSLLRGDGHQPGRDFCGPSSTCATCSTARWIRSASAFWAWPSSPTPTTSASRPHWTSRA
ncbi:MAG: hypothetical protein R2851_23450 [Caldilineaceae bacterium]